MLNQASERGQTPAFHICGKSCANTGFHAKDTATEFLLLHFLKQLLKHIASSKGRCNAMSDAQSQGVADRLAYELDAASWPLFYKSKPLSIERRLI